MKKFLFSLTLSICLTTVSMGATLKMNDFLGREVISVNGQSVYSGLGTGTITDGSVESSFYGFCLDAYKTTTLGRNYEITSSGSLFGFFNSISNDRATNEAKTKKINYLIEKFNNNELSASLTQVGIWKVTNPLINVQLTQNGITTLNSVLYNIDELSRNYSLNEGFLTLTTNGAQPYVGPKTNSVPEPSTIGLLVLGILFTLKPF